MTSRPYRLLVSLLSLVPFLNGVLFFSDRAVSAERFSEAIAAQSAPTMAPSDRVCLNKLPSAINAVIQRPEFRRSRFGVMVQTLKTRQTLYERDAQQFFIPASNTKLLSTAATLQKLGAQYRIRTSVYGRQTKQGWILRLVGRGDPSLTDAKLANLAQQLRQQGIERVAHLWIDASHYQGDQVNGEWAVGDVQAGFGLPVSSFILNRNSIHVKLIPQKVGQPLRVEWKEDQAEASRWQIVNQSVTVDPKAAEFVQVSRDLSQPILRITGQLRQGAAPEDVEVGVLDPNERVLRHFQQALGKAGISVERAAVRQDDSLKLLSTEMASLNSPPLIELIQEANKNSDNLYAEALLKVLGANSPEAVGSSTLEKGLGAMSQILAELGVDQEGFSLVDGSGLARQNLISPFAIVQTLQAMSERSNGAQFRGSLAVAGRSGTLRSRFLDTPAQGIVQGKTGTLTGVAALSGYVSPRQFVPLVFSVIVNQSTKDARPAIDEIIVMLARLSPCENNSSGRR